MVTPITLSSISHGSKFIRLFFKKAISHRCHWATSGQIEILFMSLYVVIFFSSTPLSTHHVICLFLTFYVMRVYRLIVPLFSLESVFLFLREAFPLFLNI